jgi:hypothetical protein
MSETTLEELPRDHEEFKWAKAKMRDTIREHPSGTFDDYKIYKIEKIHNIDHWRRYAQKKKSIKRENNNDANERWLFHGTNEVEDILQDGFLVEYASDRAMFGPGIVSP